MVRCLLALALCVGLAATAEAQAFRPGHGKATTPAKTPTTQKTAPAKSSSSGSSSKASSGGSSSSAHASKAKASKSGKHGDPDFVKITDDDE